MTKQHGVSRMKREKMFSKGQRAELSVGMIGNERMPGTVFQGRVSLLLLLDFEQALELQRCLVEAMQRQPADEVLQIELEPGDLELYPNDERSEDTRAPIQPSDLAAGLRGRPPCKVCGQPWPCPEYTSHAGRW